MPLRKIFAISNIFILLIGSATALENPEIRESSQIAQLENKDLPQSDFRIKTQVALVSFDAVVQNSKGQFIENLQSNDFQIYDDKVAQQIELFSPDSKPLDIALVIDASGSEQNYRSQHRAAALDVLQKLNPKEDRIALFCFGTYPIQLTGLTLDHSLIIGAFERIPEMGVSSIAEALLDATQYLALQPKGRRRAILLISDNVQNLSPQLIENDEGIIQEMLEVDVTLISIKTPGTKSIYKPTKMQVSRIAADTGGEVLDANSLDVLSDALSAAVLRLKNSYVIGFYPSDERDPGSYHKLTIQLDKNKCSDCKIWTRKGYYAGGQAIAESGNKKGSKKSSLAPKKAWWGPFFGIAMIESFSSPQTLLYNAALTKINRKESSTWYTNESDAGYWTGLLGANLTGADSVLGKYGGSAFQSEGRRLIDDIADIPVMSRVSQRYLTGLKMLWTGSNKKAITLLFNYLFVKNEDRHFNDVRKRLNFQIVATRLSENQNKQVIRIDLKCDASRLFIFFNDGLYKSWLVVAPKYGEERKSESFIKVFEPGYSEKEFKKALQSGIPLSFTMEIPKSESKIKLLVFNPVMSIYGISEIKLEQ